MAFQGKENLFQPESLIRLHCPFKNCEKFYKNKKSLNEHFRLYPAHKPESSTSHKRISAKELAENFLRDGSPYSRRQRVRELFTCLSDEELVEFALPRIATVVPPVDVFLKGTSCASDIFGKLVKFRDELCIRVPELTAFFYPRTPPTFQDPKQTFVDIALSNKSCSSAWFLDIDHGSLFRDFLMPLVVKREHSAFREFSCGIAGSFAIGQKETQVILRNKLGRKLQTVIGINPILSKEEIFGQLNDTRQELLNKIGLQFNEFGEVVVGYVNIEQYLTMFLSQSGMQGAITAPNNNLMLMDYTDGFPWMKWSRHFTGETSVRVKIIEPYNLLSTVLTVALWLGSDEYDTVKNCAQPVFQQLRNLKTISHPLTGQELTIVRRSCGDGKERRSSTGNSSAKSSYPIPEAPEHHTQLGDMKIVCPHPVWSVEDTETLERKFEMELNGKAPSKEKRREFAKQNLGNTGRKNICGTPLTQFYPGTAHLGFRSAETLCLRIAKVASGLYHFSCLDVTLCCKIVKKYIYSQASNFTTKRLLHFCFV